MYINNSGDINQERFSLFQSMSNEYFRALAEKTEFPSSGIPSIPSNQNIYASSSFIRDTLVDRIIAEITRGSNNLDNMGDNHSIDTYGFGQRTR